MPLASRIAGCYGQSDTLSAKSSILFTSTYGRSDIGVSTELEPLGGLTPVVDSTSTPSAQVVIKVIIALQGIMANLQGDLY